ncbi:protein TRIGALACTOSYLDIACYLGLYCEROL 2, chloroplastic [Physcomitrium patens]|uniref:Mce/MlaD domain-containing protein n=1 Tax=Physcomitrium patens TaxID=3218 RepID=A0A2K1JPR4_PHYPA|nr:protein TRIGALACTOSYLDIACYLGLYCEROL 2, chloroplastic-like [Physcomitrium patens]PNR43406.1 hypothetical protein PHYPA_015787 [Physcomitrium patens]|eukprot:XP_024390335.1 protein TRIGALACTOSYLDIACYLGLYCEROL 2, chloroplastic-like [Physcomitrella patens]
MATATGIEFSSSLSCVLQSCATYSCVAGILGVSPAAKQSFTGGFRARRAFVPPRLGFKHGLGQGLGAGNTFGSGGRGTGGKFVYELVYSSSSGHNGSIRAQVTNNSSDPTVPKEMSVTEKLVSLPGAIWKQILGPLSNFGFGKRSLWEGGVGLFIMSGVLLLAITLVWVKGKQIRAQTRKYEAVFEFQLAQGITVGTPVRIRGVDVGNVVQVRPSLEKIDVVVELSDAGIVVPRNALVEVNQSGLISETLIDVTPRRPIPKPTVGPLDPKCPSEGLIVCDRERIKGEQGVSLDELVGICTKIARQIDGLGVERMASMAERLGDAVQEARPLLLKVQSMAEDVEPLLKEVREGGLLKDFEKLTKVAAEAGRDLSNLNKVVLTSDNTELLRDSVSTLTKTLKHVESISKDVSGVTGDAKTRNNLRQLIESLSRLVTD